MQNAKGNYVSKVNYGFKIQKYNLITGRDTKYKACEFLHKVQIKSYFTNFICNF